MSNMSKFNRLIKALENAGIHCFFVGGCVRDEIMGTVSDDVDVCMVNADIKTVKKILAKFADGSTKDPVGSSFKVFKFILEGQEYDFAFARTERKSGEGHADFSIVTENVTIEDDLFRRDLTINAIAKRCLTGEIIDPFGGVDDIENRIARPVSVHFSEDHLRVYRAARFMSRFELEASTELVEACKKITPTNETISVDRVGKELKKMFGQAVKPSLFFDFLKKIDWLKYHFQELADLIGVEQNPTFHPEGDAYVHTLACMDATENSFVRSVMLCHDLGKSVTTELKNGNWVSPGHAKESVPMTDAMLKRLKFADHKTIEKIKWLVEHHMVHTETPISFKRARKLWLKMQKIGVSYQNLVDVCEADKNGRPPLESYTPDIGQNFVPQFEELDKFSELVNGRMLIDKFGYEQGPKLGNELKRLKSLFEDGDLNSNNLFEKIRHF